MVEVIALSGPIAVGKSSFVRELVAQSALYRPVAEVSTRAWIVEHKKVGHERGALQAAGDELDCETAGRWVTDAVLREAENSAKGSVLLLDSVRTADQLRQLRGEFGDKLLHIHLHAPRESLAHRYANRRAAGDGLKPYEEVIAQPTEALVDGLKGLAGLVLEADGYDPAVLAETAWAFVEGGQANQQRLVDVIVGAQYGSEGKGNIVAHIAAGYDTLVRVGGPNAGHKVFKPEYTYVQLPSGTGSAPDAQVFIAAGSTIWLPQMMKEIADHELTGDRLSIDPRAIVIDDEDRRLEAGELGSIGSTKQGAGSAAARKILNRGQQTLYGPPVRLATEVPQLAKYVREVRGGLERLMRQGKRVLIEGTQGTDLSIHHGRWPHVTSRETSAAGCLSDVGISPSRVQRIIMVLRTYPIRVGGKSGWMGDQISLEVIAERSGLPLHELQKTEMGTISGNPRRIAGFDWAQLLRATQLNGATEIALTFADYLGSDNRSATDFGELNAATRKFIENVERVSGVKVALVSKAFAEDGVLDREAES